MSQKDTKTSSSTDLAPVGHDSEVCSICRGQGFVVLDVPVDHRDFGRAIPCQCQAQQRERQRQASLARVSNLTQLHHMTFDTFYPDGVGLPTEQQANLRWAYTTARDFAAQPQGWLFLTGAYGCGKTHLAAAIANDVVGRGEPALFVVVPDLLDHLRATFGPHSETSFDERFEDVRQASLLVLDDLGAQSATPWAKEKLFQILNHRYAARLPTVITSNLRLQEVEPRLRSRLADPHLTTVVTIRAPDFRAGGKRGTHELSTLTLYAGQTFENFDLRRDELEPNAFRSLAEAKADAEAFAVDPHTWFVLTGPSGCGKTHLAAAIANRYQQLHHDQPMFVLVSDLLDYLRDAFDPSSTSPLSVRFDEVKQSSLLVLDSFDMRSATPWAEEKMFQLLDYRYVARLPTVITSRVPVTELQPWLQSRIFDDTRCTVKAIAAPHHRGKSARRQETWQKRQRSS